MNNLRFILFVIYILLNTNFMAKSDVNSNIQYPFSLELFIEDAKFAFLVKGKSLDKLHLPSSEKDAQKLRIKLIKTSLMKNVKLTVVERKILLGDATGFIMVFISKDFSVVNIWRVVAPNNSPYPSGWQFASCKWDTVKSHITNIRVPHSERNSFKKKSLLISYENDLFNEMLDSIWENNKGEKKRQKGSDAALK